MARELTTDEITSRELERLVSQVDQRELREQIQAAMSKLELHKTYGLRFERHIPEVITHDGKTITLGDRYFPWLKKVDQVQGSEPRGPEHILIESDNYVTLKYLQYTHQGKVDVIYIDPPYNTGAKDWKYNDQYVDEDDIFLHSKWLSFMEKRLLLARTLLSDSGVVFISIGDDGVAALTLLCDDIFGRKNHVGTIARVAKTTSNKGTFFAPSKDYILCYKHKNRTEGFSAPLTEEYVKQFNKEENGEKYKEVGLYQSSLDPRGCPNQRYWIECPDGELVIPPGKCFPDLLTDAAHIKPLNAKDKIWRWSFGTYLERKNELAFKKTATTPLLNQHGEKAKWNVYVKMGLAGRMADGLRPRDFLNTYLNAHGTSAVKALGLEFNYAKPPELIKFLIEITSKKNGVILDFFAGSGTTFQAVAELNESDGGTRQCILVTNNESNICRDVTWERVKRVTTGTNSYPECTKKYDGNPSAHATFYTMEIYGEDAIDAVSRGWVSHMEGYLPLLSTQLNLPHRWQKIPDASGFYQGPAAVIAASDLDFEAQQFLKKEHTQIIAIISNDIEEFDLAKGRCQKATKASQFIFLPRAYKEYFENFHSKE